MLKRHTTVTLVSVHRAECEQYLHVPRVYRKSEQCQFSLRECVYLQRTCGAEWRQKRFQLGHSDYSQQRTLHVSIYTSVSILTGCL